MGTFIPRCLLLSFAFLQAAQWLCAGEAPNRPPQPVIPDKVFNIVSNGAVGDGKTIATAAIQKTIDQCSAAGGGTVLIPAGDYLTGPLALGSRTRLDVAKDAILRFDNRISNWPKDAKGFADCITAANAADIEIRGPGRIEGQGAPWWTAFLADKTGFPHRPCLILLSGCARVLVKDITLADSPGFHLVPAHCTDVTIEGVVITAPADSPNTDGIDASGWNYSITRCTIDVGDDNIALKPGGPGSAAKPSCSNFAINDCVFLHGHGLSIGGQTEGGLRDMRVGDCIFNGTTNGIRMKASRERGGTVEDLRYDRITMINVKNPIVITSYYPKAPKTPEEDPAQPSNTRGPVWRNVTISDLTAAGSGNAGLIWGVPELPVSNITFNNVKISARQGMQIRNARGISFVNSRIDAESGDNLLLFNAQVSGIQPGLKPR